MIPIEVPYGDGITLDQLRAAIASAGGKVDIVWVVHAETSTGFLHTQLKEMADIAHEAGGLFLLDTVTGLGGNDLKVRELWVF